MCRYDELRDSEIEVPCSISLIRPAFSENSMLESMSQSYAEYINLTKNPLGDAKKLG